MTRSGLLLALAAFVALACSCAAAKGSEEASAPDIPESCLEAIEVGPGKASIERWAFDPATYKCTNFTWGGAQPGKNNFESEKDCLETCKVPAGGYDICSLPKQPGLCMAYMPSWWFNPAQGKCKKFVYGGCGGNPNRFTSKAACEAACKPPACEQPKVEGRCRGFFKSWYYDQEKGKCRTFVYGGCGGNDNRYVTKAECKGACGKPAICSQPIVPGRCMAYFPSWGFNADSGKCEEFVYGGCEGNDNRFESKEACEAACPEPEDGSADDEAEAETDA